MKKAMNIVAGVLLGISAAHGKATTGIAIFNHSVGARQSGMADAAVGIADDVNALYYNPAGLATVRAIELNAMYFDNIMDTTEEAVSGVFPLRKGIFGGHASVGLGIKAYQGGNIEVLVGDYNAGGTFTVLSEQTLSAENDYMGSIAYAEELMPGIYAGAAVKMVRATLVEEYTASAFAADVGILYRTPVKGLSLGFSALNNGTELKFVGEGDALPQRLIAGAGLSLNPMNSVVMKLGADYVKEREMDGAANVGMEAELMNRVIVRAGYLTASDLGSITMGIGVKAGKIQLDYGYGMMHKLGNLQKASLTIRFGSNRAGKETGVKRQ